MFLRFLVRNPFFDYGKFFEMLNKKAPRESPRYLYLHMYGARALEEALKVCKGLGMKPFLLFGTLLGHYRDNGFIAHDWDIDLGLLGEDFSRATDLKSAMERKGFSVIAQSTYGIAFRHRHRFPKVKIDFYVVYRDGDRMACSVNLRGSNICYYPLDMFSEFSDAKFMGTIDTLIPAQTEKYLALTYGKDWRTPRVNFSKSDYTNVEVKKEGPR